MECARHVPPVPGKERGSVALGKTTLREQVVVLVAFRQEFAEPVAAPNRVVTWQTAGERDRDRQHTTVRAEAFDSVA